MIDAATQSQGEMPEPRRLDLPLLPTGQGERYYLERFMGAFGAEWNGTAIVVAPTGHSLAVSPLLFTNHQTGKAKVAKEGRAPYVPYIAATIKRPDEIRLETGSVGDASLYLLGWYLIARKETTIITVFKKRGTTWEGWSGYQTQNMAYVETKRVYPLIFSMPKR